MDTLTSQEAEENIEQLIHKAVKKRQNYRITSSNGESAVVMSEEAFYDITVTLELLSTFVAMEESSLDVEELSEVEAVS